MRDYSIPVYRADSQTPTYKVTISYPWSPYNVPGAGFDQPVPIPDSAIPAAGTDGHMVTIRGIYAYDFFQAKKTSSGWAATYGIRWDLSGSGQQSYYGASCRAGGTPLLAGLIMYQEVSAGKINHALAAAIPVTREICIPPASAYQKGTTDTRALPMGARFRLRPDYATGGLSAPAKAIAEALIEYGAIVVDVSQTPVIYAEDLSHDPAKRTWGSLSVGAISGIALTEYRVVE